MRGCALLACISVLCCALMCGRWLLTFPCKSEEKPVFGVIRRCWCIGNFKHWNVQKFVWKGSMCLEFYRVLNLFSPLCWTSDSDKLKELLSVILFALYQWNWRRIYRLGVLLGGRNVLFDRSSLFALRCQPHAFLLFKNCQSFYTEED